jgi:hypothetical protein
MTGLGGRLALPLLGALLGAMVASPCRAESLRDVLDKLAGFADLPGAPAGVSSSLSSAVATIERTAARSADFIPTATAPGFVYRFDIETGAAERLTLSGGPVYVEPAYTIGARRFDLALGYQYAEFTELDGEEFEDALSDILVTSTRGISVSDSSFSLNVHTASLSTTYGLTDRWDVNLLVPVVFTSLDLRSTIVLARPDIGFSDTARIDESEDKAGIGDVLVRTKYRLPDVWGFGLASVLTIRVPSGEEENLQGLGDTVVTPALTATRALGRCDVHLNAGFDANADDYERNRVRYGLGGTCETTGWLSLFAGVVGSSGTRADSFSERGARGEVARTDILDAFAGGKLGLPRNVLVYAGALVPATQDGLRAEVVPAGGIEKRW